MRVACWGLLVTLWVVGTSSAKAQSEPTWEGLGPDRVELIQQTMLLSMRLYLESELVVDEFDVSWSEAPKAIAKRLDKLVDEVMALQGERGLNGFGGFSDRILGLIEDVDELDERDLVRGGRFDLSLEQRFYLLVAGRLNELEMQLAFELGVYARSDVWSRIASGMVVAVPDDPGEGAEMERLTVPFSRRTQAILDGSDPTSLPVPFSAPSSALGMVPVASSSEGGLVPAPSAPALAALNLPASFDVPFASGSAVLDLNARMQLAEVRYLLVRYPRMHLVCTGHADANGPRRTNEELSKLRAEAVRAKLLESGVEATRVLMNYFGEDQAGWIPSEDRRVEVAFYWSLD